MDHSFDKHKYITGIIITNVIALLFSGGCGFKSGELPNYMHPEALYLNATANDQIYVEVDVMKETNLPKDYIDTLRQFLEKYCSRPSRIHIVQGLFIVR